MKIIGLLDKTSVNKEIVLRITNQKARLIAYIYRLFATKRFSFLNRSPLRILCLLEDCNPVGHDGVVGL